MLIDFLQGIILGLTAAVPLGPINLLIMNESLKSYKNGFSVGIGAMSADTSYLLLILFGLNTYFNHKIVINTLTLLGAFFLIFIAYTMYKNRNEEIKKIDTNSKGSLFKHYVKGYILTLLSPYTVVFWLSVATLSINKTNPAAIIFGMLFALMAWITVMPYFVFKTKHLISQRVYSKIAVISAFVFCCFALGMIIRLFFGFFN
ncbi:MAG: LysE family translocator [Arcobacteraceae bacterium]